MLTWCYVRKEGEKRKTDLRKKKQPKPAFTLTCHFRKGNHYAASGKLVG